MPDVYHLPNPCQTQSVLRQPPARYRPAPSRLLILILLCTVPTWAGADMYRGVDSSGRVIFSDVPLPDSERMPLPAARAQPEDSGTRFRPYQQFEILAPAPNTTLESDAGQVRVSLLLDPPLAPDHQLEVLLGGVPIADLNGRTQFELQGLPPGSHQLVGRILDEAGVMVAETAQVNFNVRPSEGAAP